MARDERDERTSGAETLRGVVEATNEKGIKIGERWVNYSQFRQVPRPDPGQEVEVELDRGRFINALTVVGGAGGGPALDEPEELTGDAFEGLASDPAPALRAQRAATPTATARPADRNTEIRRLALLKAAAEYAAPRPDMAAGDVLAVAILWEAWVIEPAD